LINYWPVSFGDFLAAFAVAVLVHQVLTTWQCWQKIEKQTFFIAVVYAAIGAAIVMAQEPSISGASIFMPDMLCRIRVLFLWLWLLFLNMPLSK